MLSICIILLLVVVLFGVVVGEVNGLDYLLTA